MVARLTEDTANTLATARLAAIWVVARVIMVNVRTRTGREWLSANSAPVTLLDSHLVVILARQAIETPQAVSQVIVITALVAPAVIGQSVTI